MRIATALGIVVLMLAAIVPVGAQERPTDRLRALEGLWRYADGQEGERRIDQAVARAVDDMPFFLEGIARGRIRARTYPHRRISFQVRGDRLYMTADNWGPVNTRVNGPAERVVGPQGDRLSFTQRIVGGRLRQRFAHPDGSRTNEFSLSGDREWLWLSVTIASPQIPDEARFRLRYRRASTPPAIAARSEGAPRGEQHAELDPRTQRPVPGER